MILPSKPLPFHLVLTLSLGLSIAGCEDSSSDHGAHGSAASGSAGGDGNGDVDMGCSGQADPYAKGMSKDGESGRFSLVLVESQPMIMGPERYAWTVQVLDASGSPVPDATVIAEPFMPAMDHGASPNPSTTNDGGGSYTLDPVNLFMPGLWEVRVDISAGADSDRVVYEFCIEGDMTTHDGGMMMDDGDMTTHDGGMTTHDGGMMMDGGM